MTRSPKRLLWRRIEELELALRPLNVLNGAGIVTLADLVRRSETELGALKNFGGRTLLCCGISCHHSVCGSGWCLGGDDVRG